METANPGTRVTAIGVQGRSGKHGVWKTQGLMENTGSLSEYEYFSLKQEVEILYV